MEHNCPDSREDIVPLREVRPHHRIWIDLRIDSDVSKIGVDRKRLLHLLNCAGISHLAIVARPNEEDCAELESSAEVPPPKELCWTRGRIGISAMRCSGNAAHEIDIAVRSGIWKIGRDHLLTFNAKAAFLQSAVAAMGIAQSCPEVDTSALPADLAMGVVTANFGALVYRLISKNPVVRISPLNAAGYELGACVYLWAACRRPGVFCEIGKP